MNTLSRTLARPVIIAVCCAVCAGCGGFGLGGGGGTGVVPSALELENPARKGKVAGHVSIASGLAAGALEEAAEDDRSLSALPGGFEVLLAGSRGRWTRKPDGDGAFDFSLVYAGSYVLTLFHKGRRLAGWPLQVTEKSSLELSVDLLGPDLADVDGDGDRDEFVARMTAVVKERETEYRRTFFPDGSARTLLPDGTVEFYQAGRVRIRKPSGEILYRNDYDNDFLPDELDNDDDNDGVSDDRDRDLDNDGIVDERFRRASSPAERMEAALAGRSARPFIESVTVSLVGREGRSVRRAAPGDLLHFEVTTNPGGGAAVIDLEGRIYRKGGKVYTFKPLDDGSKGDLVDSWPGLQVSGDRKAGDGIFSYILPIDRSTAELLHECLLVFCGRNRNGTLTNRRVVALSIGLAGAKASGPGARGTPLGSRMGEFAMYERLTPGGDRRLVARVDADSSENLAVRLVLPGGEERLLSPRLRNDGRTVFASSDMEWRKGLYLLVATDDDAAVFYAGFPVTETADGQ